MTSRLLTESWTSGRLMVHEQGNEHNRGSELGRKEKVRQVQSGVHTFKYILIYPGTYVRLIVGKMGLQLRGMLKAGIVIEYHIHKHRMESVSSMTQP